MSRRTQSGLYHGCSMSMNFFKRRSLVSYVPAPAFQQVDDGAAGALVEVAGGLVGQEEPGLADQRPGERVEWEVTDGTILVFDPRGDNEEAVLVKSYIWVNPSDPNEKERKLYAHFMRSHGSGAPVICHGNPGPMERYNPRTDTDVVPYFQHRDIVHPIFRVLDQTSDDVGADARLQDEREIGGHESHFSLGAQWAWGKNVNRQYANSGGQKGALAKDQNDFASTLAVYAEGRQILADELGMRPLAAHCHHGLGILYAKIGQREQAQAVDDFIAAQFGRGFGVVGPDFFAGKNQVNRPAGGGCVRADQHVNARHMPVAEAEGLGGGSDARDVLAADD